MAGLSANRILFGVHSISPYRRSDKFPYGILKVIGQANLALTSSVEQLYGGSNRFPWTAESKTIGSTIDAKVKAYPGFLFQLFLGATNTDNVAEATGSVTTLTNYLGTSVVVATTGIASVSVKTGSETDVKFGKYLVVVTGAAAVDVYAYSDIDFARGVDLTYQNDALKITATPLTITTGGVVDIPNTGLQLHGGSGIIAMTIGDTATFSARPINTASSDVIVGNSITSLPAFGAIMLAQKRADAEMFEIEAFNVIGSGMPIPMAEFAFSTTDLKMTCLYDSTADAVFKFRHVTPTTTG